METSVKPPQRQMKRWRTVLLALLAAIPNFLIGLLSSLLARLNHRS